MPNATLFKPRETYERTIKETFQDFPPSSLPLIETLLAIDPAERLTATAALQSEVRMIICVCPFIIFVDLAHILMFGSCSLDSLR